MNGELYLKNFELLATMLKSVFTVFIFFSQNSLYLYIVGGIANALRGRHCEADKDIVIIDKVSCITVKVSKRERVKTFP